MDTMNGLTAKDKEWIEELVMKSHTSLHSDMTGRIEGAKKDLVEDIQQMRDSFASYETKMEPIYRFYENMNFAKTLLMWFLGFVALLGAAWTSIKGFIMPK